MIFLSPSFHAFLHEVRSRSSWFAEARSDIRVPLLSRGSCHAKMAGICSNISSDYLAIVDSVRPCIYILQISI